jgi:hypothetical protein
MNISWRPFFELLTLWLTLPTTQLHRETAEDENEKGYQPSKLQRTLAQLSSSQQPAAVQNCTVTHIVAGLRTDK